MASQQYSLRWNNYLRHITYAFENLRNQDDFVDVTLFCEGRKIKAHKVLLSACSGYFKEIFKESPHPHPVIIFKFIKFDDLAAIIEFMYQGEVNVQQEALQSFLQTAELLAVQGLTSEEKEKEAPKPKTKTLNEQLLKSIPITSTLRTVTTETIDPQPQNTTIEFSATDLVSNATSTPATVQISAANINLKKRKISFNPESETVYTTETVEFTTKDDPTVKTAELQYIPSTVKMDLPEYIDCNQIGESSEVHTQNEPGTDASQTVTQFSANEFEILTESEIEQHNVEHVSETASDVSGIQMGRILSTSADSLKLESKTLQANDLPSSKWTECQFCKMVITTVNLWRHIRTQHTPQPPRRCEHCNKNFKNKYSLREHIRISHEQQKPSSIPGKVEN